MALEKSIDTKSGFNCPTSYIVITDLVYSKGSKVGASYSAYLDKQSYVDGMDEIAKGCFGFNLDILSGLNIIAQAYAALKTDEDFSDAKDV